MSNSVPGNEGDRLRVYLNAAKRQQHTNNDNNGGSLNPLMASPTLLDDNDYRDLEALESLTDMDDLINTVLSKDANLKELLTQQDAELDSYMDSFINAHCDEAENLCNLYHQVTECEGKLNDFENQIRDFLDRLTETADEVVQMQRSTDDLHVRVQNRKAVKAEITLVYEAIMECGKFCDDIVRRDVDAAFLHEMRAYDAKLSKWNSLLESNPNLKGSAVDLEISPRLAAAAQRVGDKLERHMQTRFDALQDPGINVVLHQQIMEATGMYAYRFLASYNGTVAERLKSNYLGIIAEVHGKSIRNALKDVIDAGTFASLPYEAVLPSHVLRLMENGQDLDVQKDFFLNLSKAFGGQVLSVRDRTVSAEAAALGLPPLASPKSCRFYLREDEYLAEFVSSNELSDTPSPSSGVPRRANSVMPTASPAAGVTRKRASSVSGSSGGGGSGLSLNLSSMKSFVKQHIATTTMSSAAKELGNTTPFTNAKDLRAATFENQVHALRAIHILEAAANVGGPNSASNPSTAADSKVSPTPSLGASPERSNHVGGSSLPSGTIASANSSTAAAPAVTAVAVSGQGPKVTGDAPLVPPNYMGTVVLDPIVVGRLSKTDCWAVRFVVLLATVVNALTAERKFVRNFFLSHVRDTLRGDLMEEGILRSIFGHILSQVETALQTEIEALTDPITMLVALRSVELLKNFVFQCPSPNPIMLLSSVFGTVSNSLREGLYKFLVNDERSLQAGLGARPPAIDKSTFRSLASAPTFNGELDVVALVQQDATFASSLTVHPVVVAVSQLTAKLHALNVLHLKGSYVDVGSDATTFDDTVETSLRSIVASCFNLIDHLSRRYADINSRIPSLVFIIVNLGHLLYRWLAAARSARGMPSSMPLLVSHRTRGAQSQNNTLGQGKEAADNAPAALLLKAQLLFDDEDNQREAKNTGASKSVVTREGAGRSVSPSRGNNSMSPSRARFVATQSLSQLDQALSERIAEFVEADITARYPSLRKVMDVINKIEDTLGPEGLSGTTEGSAPCPVDAAVFAEAATSFSSGWQDQLGRIRTSLKTLFATTVMMMIGGPNSTPASSTATTLYDADALLKAAENAVSSAGAQPLSAVLPHVNAAVLTRASEANELLKRVLHDYFRVIVDANSKLLVAARRYYPDDSLIHSKLVGHHALEHELQQLLGRG